MICTFYSYKGGVGRSMALANVADRLSRQRLKTLIIDFDLEAPGLERFFPIETQAARENPGLLELLIAYKQAMSQPLGRGTRDFQKLERYIFPIYFELPGGGLLHLLPAGMRADEAQLSNYAYQLRTFDWQEFYFEWGGNCSSNGSSARSASATTSHSSTVAPASPKWAVSARINSPTCW
jgi:cellulose biosynthesis protein BcsQ